MAKRLVVIPEKCSGCKICEVVCSIHRFGVNNTKKSAIRVMVLYPHPVIRMPIFCNQCREPKCQENCPSEAIVRKNDTVEIDEDRCISCQQCVVSCPFGAIFLHEDIPVPFKCNLCGGVPQCVRECPNNALFYQPEHILGQAQRVGNALKYTHMKEVLYIEKGEKKRLRYVESGREKEEG